VTQYRIGWLPGDGIGHDVMNALEQATAGCDKRYSKGKVSFELLAKVNPAHVEAACPHARSLLDRLRTL